MEFTRILYGVIFIIVLLALFDIGQFGAIFEDITRVTGKRERALSRCALYGGRFYGLGGKCDEPLSWPEVIVLGLFIIGIYKVIYR